MSRRLNDLMPHPLTFNGAVKMLSVWARDWAQPRYVSTCTAYTAVRGLEDPAIFTALRRADMLTADGMPLVWFQRLRGHRAAERVYGPDVMLKLCELTAGDPAVSHFLWGGLPGVPEALAAELSARFPGIHIAGIFSPPVGEVGTQPDPAVVERLNASGAAVVWVGLGSPKQDLWMALYRPVLTAPLLIGVGAAFDFIAGTKAQAPHWMRRSGLEWLFRLAQEPRRLAKRYLVYNARFVGAAIRSLLTRR